MSLRSNSFSTSSTPVPRNCPRGTDRHIYAQIGVGPGALAHMLMQFEWFDPYEILLAEAAEKLVYNYHLGDRGRSARAAGAHIERELRELAPNAAIRFERLAVTIEQIDDLEPRPGRPRTPTSVPPTLAFRPGRNAQQACRGGRTAVSRPSDPSDHLAGDGDPESIVFEETDTGFQIAWLYRLDGLAFVYTDRYSRRVSTILGYPTRLLAMDRNFKNFWLALDRTLGGLIRTTSRRPSNLTTAKNGRVSGRPLLY